MPITSETTPPLLRAVSSQYITLYSRVLTGLSPLSAATFTGSSNRSDDLGRDLLRSSWRGTQWQCQQQEKANQPDDHLHLPHEPPCLLQCLQLLQFLHAVQLSSPEQVPAWS